MDEVGWDRYSNLVPGCLPLGSLDWLKSHPWNEFASSVIDLPRSNLARTLATINALLREGDGKQSHAILVGVSKESLSLEILKFCV